MLSYISLLGLLALSSQAQAVNVECDGSIWIKTVDEFEALRRSCNELSAILSINITEPATTVVLDWPRADSVSVYGHSLTLILGSSSTRTMEIGSLNLFPGVDRLQLSDAVEALTIDSMEFWGSEGDEGACTEIENALNRSGMALGQLRCPAKPDIELDWGSGLSGATDEDAESRGVAMGTVRFSVGFAVGVATLTFLAITG